MTPRTCSRACSGARTCARRGASLWPLARAPSNPAQYCGPRLSKDPRAAGGARGVPGPAAGRAGARDLPEAAQGETRGAQCGGEAEDLGRAGRQVRPVRLRADGRHLRAGPRGAGEAGLCGQRANSAGAVRQLPQREDAASAQPTSLESRVAPGVMEYARSPKLPLVFEAQACAASRKRDALYVGVDVVRCRRNGLALASICCRTWGPAGTRRFRWPRCWTWDHIVLGISARSHVDAATLRRTLERMDAAWPEGEEHMAKLSVNAMIGLWARSTEAVYSVRSSSSELDGAGADFFRPSPTRGAWCGTSSTPGGC